ncbi:MAG: DNA polymerase III subunit alpha, partial [bacterium]|nr:DNA polymerase III subunit alpha [bacterium]
ISKEPLENIVPLQHPTQNDQTIVTQYEMHSIEDLGILKMDFLGLKNLTIIEDTLARIYKIHNQSINIDAIPLDDKKTYELLQRGESTSVFQLESGGMQRYLKQLKPTELEDIISMVALYRPGPMDSIPDFIAQKHGKKKIIYLHSSLKPILEKTYGVIVTQDQVLEIARSFSGFTYSQADILRKAVGKKIKKLLDEQKEKFITGAKNTQKIEAELAEKVWNFIEPFAGYGFNRAHAAAYATIAYQTAWLKAHYPVEFMSAVLTSEKADVERIAVLIEECKKMKIEVLPPDVNESFMNFSVVDGKNQIRFGLLAIKNVGHNVVEAILMERKERGPYASISDFVSRVSSKDLNKKSLESMIKAGVFDKLGERNQLLQNMEKLLEQARISQKNKINGQKGLFDSAAAGQVSTTWKIKLTAAIPSPESEKLKWEKELLGLYVSGHPLLKYQKLLEKNCLPIVQVSQDLAGRVVRIGGVISSIKKIITKKGQPMLFVNLEDEASRIELVVFPSILENYPAAFQENKIVFVSGKVDMRDNIPKIICNTIEEIVEE